ncbi:MAG: hypothetical protein AAFX06_23240 [Planctomycetota bacterium]
MANEIRVLEDQLYEADYQNRVLRDELRRARENCDPLETPPAYPESYGPIPESSIDSLEPPVIIPTPEGEPLDPGLPQDDLGLGDPFKDEPSGESPSGADEPSGSDTPPSMDALENPSDRAIPTPLGDPPPAELPAPKSDGETIEDIEPGIPTPPGNMEIPKIVPGEPIPPGSGEPAPSQIELPQTASVLQREPPLTATTQTVDHIALHPNLSGGHQFDADDDIDGLYVVVTVMDGDGEILSLNQFDVDAEMSIVVIDPDATGDGARLGRWDFSPKEVRSFIRSTPTDGLHVPIKWKQLRPSGKDVIVHVRMAAAEEEMRCQGRLRLEQSVAVSHWLPRG